MTADQTCRQSEDETLGMTPLLVYLILILDDKKYFLYGGDNNPGNDRYYTDDKDKCPDNVRFKCKTKLEFP